MNSLALQHYLLEGVGLAEFAVTRELAVGLARASKYMLLSTLIISSSILWITIYVLNHLGYVLAPQNTFENFQQTVLYLTANPQFQAAMLGMAFGFLIGLYATFAEFIPTLREFGGGGLSTAASMIATGFILTVVFFAVPMMLLPIYYGVESHLHLSVLLSVLPLGGIVTYLVGYVGFLLALVRLGDLTGETSFTVAGVLALVSTFIQPLGPVAWLIVFTSARRLLRRSLL